MDVVKVNESKADEIEKGSSIIEPSLNGSQIQVNLEKKE